MYNRLALLSLVGTAREIVEMVHEVERHGWKTASEKHGPSATLSFAGDVLLFYGPLTRLSRMARAEAKLGSAASRSLAPARLRGITGAGEAITDAQAEAIYAAIRRMRGDVRAISQSTGIPKDVIRSVRQHLFLDTQEIAVGPGQTIRSRFTADPEIAELWTRATGRGAPLTAEEAASFRRIVAHEYVERAMMRHGGMPYRSLDPVAWHFVEGDWEYRPTPGALGAHDVAPLADWQSPPWRHYPGLGLGQPAGR